VFPRTIESPAHADEQVVLRAQTDWQGLDSRALRHAAQREAARAVIARRLGRPGLSAKAIAAALGISLRQVHILFEPTGLTLHQTIMALRVEEARRQLRTMADRTIAEIAFACGFGSLPTFHRVFLAQTGTTPNAYRRAASNGQRDLLGSRGQPGIDQGTFEPCAT
jgi:AraC-like DNA-binding protein